MRRPAGFSREASDAARFMVPSWPEIRKLFAIAVADLDEHMRDVTTDGAKILKPAHLVNAVLAWFLSRPRSEQIEIARQGRKACEWLRNQSEIPDFQRFDMESILQEWDRLKSGSPSLRIGGDDATRQHAITNDDNKKRFELKGETAIDAESKPVYKKGRSVTQKVRQPRRKGIA